MSQQASCRLTPHLRMVRVVRVFTSMFLSTLGCPQDMIDDCVAVVSELVANAIEAEAQDAPGLLPEQLPLIGVRLEVTDRSVVMAVSDASPRDPIWYLLTPDGERHRGQVMVAELCGHAAEFRHLGDGTKEVYAWMERRAALVGP